MSRLAYRTAGLALGARVQVLRSPGLALDVEGHFRQVDRVHLLVRPVEPEFRQEGGAVQALPVGQGRRGGEPTALAAHDLVDDEGAGGGAVLGDDVLEEAGALLGGGPGTQ